MDEWIKETRYIYKGILFSLNKEENPAIGNVVNEPGGRYAKCNKPDTERQTQYDLTHRWNLKESRSEQQRVGWWLPGWGLRGRGDGEPFIGQRVQSFHYTA